MSSVRSDPRQGLEWEGRPSARQVTWSEAAVSAEAAGWRLPSLGELIGLLGELRDDTRESPRSGATFWSSNGSPFAPASQVRAVRWEEGGRLTVLLLPKTERAQRWGVRRRREP